jgi:uncharacterized membrane protein YhhN
MQTVLVYSNPVEAMMWEALMDGSAWPYIAAALAFLVTALVIYQLIAPNRFGKPNRVTAWCRRHEAQVCSVPAMFVAIVVCRWLMV